MYPNVWNIKEILSVSNGGSKSSGRSSGTSDYSSLTDSQFLFGSQFWPDQTQGLSEEMSLQSRNSQPNSQEGNESKISTNYHTKPYLFGGDSKDKSKGPSFSCSNSKGMLEKFEEDKKKAKEREESEMLLGELSQLKECMENIKISLSGIEGNICSTKKAVVEALGGFTKTLQGAVGSIQEGFASQLEAVLNKLSSQSESLREMEDRENKTVSEMSSLGSCVRSLQRELESLRVEQAREQCMMGEVLSLLQALAAAPRSVAARADCSVQTSPCPWERVCLVSEEKRYFQGLRFCAGSAPQPLGYPAIALPHQSAQEPGPTRDPTPQAAASAEPERVSETQWQKPYRTRSASARRTDGLNTGAQALPQEAAASSRHSPHSPPAAKPERCDHSIRRTAQTEQDKVPQQARSQRRAVKRGQRTWPPKRRKRKALALSKSASTANRKDSRRSESASTANGKNSRRCESASTANEKDSRGNMWQECDRPSLPPAATSCQSLGDVTSCQNSGAQFSPCGVWSQDSNSTQFIAGCEKITASFPLPLCEPKTRITQKGFWQLFDFCDDSE